MTIRDEILAAKSSVRRVEVIALQTDTPIYVSMPTLDTLEALAERQANGNKVVELLLVAVVEEDGSPVFTDDDREELGGLPFAVVAPIIKAFNDHNGLSENGRAELGKGLPETVISTSRTLSAVN